MNFFSRGLFREMGFSSWYTFLLGGKIPAVIFPKQFFEGGYFPGRFLPGIAKYVTFSSRHFRYSMWRVHVLSILNQGQWDYIWVAVEFNEKNSFIFPNCWINTLSILTKAKQIKAHKFFCISNVKIMIIISPRKHLKNKKLTAIFHQSIFCIKFLF